MEKLRSTIKQFVRDWSEEVGITFLVVLGEAQMRIRVKRSGIFATNR